MKYFIAVCLLTFVVLSLTRTNALPERSPFPINSASSHIDPSNSSKRDGFYCTTYCPSHVTAGGVSGQRTGEDGYVAKSWGPAGPLNTGYYAAPDYAGQKLSTDCPSTLSSNTTYTWCEWAGGVYADGASNVVIHGCIIHGSPRNFYDGRFDSSNVTIEYCEFRPPTSVRFQAAVPGGDATTSQFGVIQNSGTGKIVLSHVEIWGCANAVTMVSGSVTMTYVWIHDPRDPKPQADHTDGYLDNQLSGKPPATLRMSYSTISAEGNTNGIGQQGQAAGYADTNITHSYFSGFAYSVNLCGHGAGCTQEKRNIFTDNQFGDDFKARYGLLYGGIYAHFLWRRNIWVNTLGGYDATNAAAHNGKFVLPSGALSTSDFSGF